MEKGSVTSRCYRARKKPRPLEADFFSWLAQLATVQVILKQNPN